MPFVKFSKDIPSNFRELCYNDSNIPEQDLTLAAKSLSVVPNQQDIAVCTLAYNEICILPAFYRWIKNWAKIWVVLDHNSNDGTLEFIEHMKNRNEMQIILKEEPEGLSNGLWAEWNKVIELAENTNCKWIWKGYPDEFPSPEIIDLSSILKDEASYYFYRYNLSNLFPLLRNKAGEDWFPYLWPSSWNMRFQEVTNIHIKEPFLYFGRRVIESPFLHVVHVGECRNFNKVREKEAIYEKLSPGVTVMGKDWDIRKKQQFVNISEECTNGWIINLLE